MTVSIAKTDSSSAGLPFDRSAAVPPLQNGDRLTRDEFERRYDAMPNLRKAELIEGVVYVASPVGFRPHGEPHATIGCLLVLYRAMTPGVVAAADASVRLDPRSMPQPDVAMFILPECGGQARIDEDDYISGAPELVGEVAASSVSYDLHDKFQAFERTGVRECIVWRVLDRQIDWFVLRDGRFERLAPGDDGVFRSTVFPGLWLDAAALIRGDIATAIAVIQQGLDSPEHAEFVARLEQTRQASATV